MRLMLVFSHSVFGLAIADSLILACLIILCA
jgi:hypothetical protein